MPIVCLSADDGNETRVGKGSGSVPSIGGNTFVLDVLCSVVTVMVPLEVRSVVPAGGVMLNLQPTK